MISKILKTKTIIAAGLIGITSLVTMSYIGLNSASNRSDIYRLNSGIDICFQRISQSFTALMIRDLSSAYLSKDFHSVTGECFNEVARNLSSVNANKNILTSVNNLKSDFYWFGQKVTKIQGMLQESDMDLSKSNITQKYYELYSLKSEIEDSLSQVGEQNYDSLGLSKWASYISVFIMFLASMAFLLKKKITLTRESELLTQLESSMENDYETKSRLIDQILNENLSKKSAKMITNMFRKLEGELVETQQILLRSNTHTQQEIYDITNEFEHINTINDETNLETILEAQNQPYEQEVLEIGEELDLILLTAVETLKDKLVTSNIEVDFNFSEQLYVKGKEEDIQQFLYTLMNHLVSNISDDSKRKLNIKSKALGGLVYCQFELDNNSLSSEETAVLLGKEPQEDTPVGLVLLKELLKDIGAGINIENKFDSEKQYYTTLIDIIFDKARAKEVSSEKTATQIVKGNKAEIRKYLDGQLGLT